MSIPFENTYDLSESQLENLEKAEEMMLKNDTNAWKDKEIQFLYPRLTL